MRFIFIFSFLILANLISPLLPLVIANATYVQALRFEALLAIYFFVFLIFLPVAFLFRKISLRIELFLVLFTFAHLILLITGLLPSLSTFDLVSLFLLLGVILGAVALFVSSSAAFRLNSSLSAWLIIVILGSDIYSFYKIFFLQKSYIPVSANNLLGSKAPKLPRVIHVVMDEFSATQEYNPYMDRADAFFREINTGLLFKNAYSNALSTRESLDQIFSGDLSSSAYTKDKTFFQALLNKGYAVNLYLSDGVIPCDRFPSTHCFDSQWATANVLFENNLFKAFSFQIRLLMQLSPLNKLLMSSFSSSKVFVTKSISLALFEKALNDIETDGDSNYYLVHLMLPHPPIVHDEECAVIGDVSLLATDPDLYQDTMEKGYMRQVHCANKVLVQLFSALKEKNIFDSTLIVVQGDHGARFRKPKNKAVCSDEMQKYRRRASHSFLWYKPVASSDSPLSEFEHVVNLLDVTQTLSEDLSLGWSSSKAVNIRSSQIRKNDGYLRNEFNCSSTN